MSFKRLIFRYVATDFQLYLMAPIVFLLLYRSPKIGIIFNILVIILGMFIALAPKILFGIAHIFEYSKHESRLSVSASVAHHYLGA